MPTVILEKNYGMLFIHRSRWFMGRFFVVLCFSVLSSPCFANICLKAFILQQNSSLKPSSNITEIEKKYLLQDHSQTYLSPIFKHYFGNWNYLIKTIKARGDVVTQGFLKADLHAGIARRFSFSEIDFTPTEVRIIKVVRTQNNNKIDYIYSAKGPGTYSRRETEYYITKEQFHQLWDLTIGRRVHRLRLNLDVITHLGEKEISLDYYLDRKLFIAEVEFKTEKEGNSFHDLGKDVTEISHYKNAKLAN